MVCLSESQTRCKGSFFLSPPFLSLTEEVEFMGKSDIMKRPQCKRLEEVRNREDPKNLRKAPPETAVPRTEFLGRESGAEGRTLENER